MEKFQMQTCNRHDDELWPTATMRCNILHSQFWGDRGDISPNLAAGGVNQALIGKSYRWIETMSLFWDTMRNLQQSLQLDTKSHHSMTQTSCQDGT